MTGMAKSLQIGGAQLRSPTGSFQLTASTTMRNRRWADYTPSAAVPQDASTLWPATPDATPLTVAQCDRGLNFSTIMAMQDGMSVGDYNAKNFPGGLAEIAEGGADAAAVGQPVEAHHVGHQVLCAALGALLDEQEDLIPKVKVKNTFIDDFDSVDDIAIASHQLGAHSLPVSLIRSTYRQPTLALFNEPTQPIQTNTTVAVMNQPTLQPSQPVYMGSPAMTTAQNGQMMVRGQPLQPIMMPVMMPQQATMLGMPPGQMQGGSSPVSTQVVTPYESRQPQPSAGSAIHGTGQCRPCAWFWKPQGCANGMDCRHCHMCPEGELKNRKKDKVAVMRTQGSRH